MTGAEEAADRIDVVIPTYRRPVELRRCLVSLSEQTLQPNRVIVVVRPDDSDSSRIVAELDWERVRTTVVQAPGMIAALRQGVSASDGDIVAFTDDDAAPRRDWLELVSRHFSDPRTGAVGGRDVLEDVPADQAAVGQLAWYGRLVGNHHAGKGDARTVDCLKGVNMAFRADALALPVDGLLQGRGAQPHNEPIPCRFVQRRGLNVVYDPAVLVDHFPAVRTAGDGRTMLRPEQTRELAHNLLVSLCILDPRRALPVFAFNLLIGGRKTPGLLRALVAAARGDRAIAGALLPSIRGALQGAVTLAKWRKKRAVSTCAELRSS